MAFSSRPIRQEEIITPKQREALMIKKDALIAEINTRLDRMEDSPDKQDLIKKRDHCISKFPILPGDLSIWIVAYHEDWFREYHRVTDDGESSSR